MLTVARMKEGREDRPWYRSLQSLLVTDFQVVSIVPPLTMTMQAHKQYFTYAAVHWTRAVH